MMRGISPCLMLFLACFYPVSACSNLVQLVGEPKSGTTWVEMIGVTIVDRYCARMLQNHSRWDPWLVNCHNVGKGNRDRIVLITPRVSMSDPPRDSEGNVQPRAQMDEPNFECLLLKVTPKHRFPFAKQRLHKDGVMTQFRKEQLSSCYNSEGPVFDDACGSDLLDPVVTESPNSRFLLALRDPRAVAVSAYHFTRGNLKMNNNKTVDELVTSWIPPMTKWIGLRHHWHTTVLAPYVETHVLFYEMIHANPLWEIERIAMFLGMSEVLTKEDYAYVANATHATAMRNLEKSGVLQGTKTKNVKVRNATAHGFKHELSAQTLAYAEKQLELLLPQSLKDLWLVIDD